MKGISRTMMTMAVAALVGMLCASGATLLRTDGASAADEGRVLRHIVLFDLKEESQTVDILNTIEAATYQMAEDIEVIQHIEWGSNLDFNTRNDGYDFVLLVEFASIEDLEVYGPHPDHDVFRAIVGPHVERVLVVDYWGKAK